MLRQKSGDVGKKMVSTYRGKVSIVDEETRKVRRTRVRKKGKNEIL